MRVNSSLTIYNKYYDSDTKLEAYQRFPLSAVEWEDRKASNVIASGGDQKANQAIIYIPFAVGNPYYLKPKAWLALSAEDKASYFTLQIDDILVKGSVSDTVNTTTFTASDLKAKYDDVLRITSVDTYDMGRFIMRHWKVGAK